MKYIKLFEDFNAVRVFNSKTDMENTLAEEMLKGLTDGNYSITEDEYDIIHQALSNMMAGELVTMSGDLYKFTEEGLRQIKTPKDIIYFLSYGDKNEDFNPTQKDFENTLAEQMFRGLSKDNYVPEDGNDIANWALDNMKRDGLVDSDSDVDHYEDENGSMSGTSYDIYWFTEEGIKEIKSPEDIKSYFYNVNSRDEDTEQERRYFSGSEGNGGHD